MKKNKYIIFATIGFELIGLLLVAIWIGDFLVKKGFESYYQAFLILFAFLIWFISLIIKLKDLKK